MPRYHFHLRDHGTIRRDLHGTELPGFDAARAHASAVAEELMRHSGFHTLYCSMLVEDGRGEQQFDLFFSDVDESLAEDSPTSRALASVTCRRAGALTDLRSAVRATIMESRILLARARRRPYLVYAKGE